jgi:hypothetical protein
MVADAQVFLMNFLQLIPPFALELARHRYRSEWIWRKNAAQGLSFPAKWGSLPFF